MSYLRELQAGFSRRVVAAAIVLATLAGSALLGQRPSRVPLLLGALVAGAAGLALLQQPGLGLVAMAALSFTLPLEIGTGSDVSLTPPALFIPVMTAVWLVESLRKGSLRLPASRTTRPLLLFVGSGLLSLAVGNIGWDWLVPRSDNLLLVQLAQWAIFAFSAAIFLLAAELGQEERWLRWATFAFLPLAGVTALLWIVPGLWGVLRWGGSANTAMLWTWLGGMGTGQLLFNRRLGTGARLGLVAALAAGAYTVWVRQSEWTSGLAPFTAAALTVAWLWFWRRNRRQAVALTLLLIVVAMVLAPFLFELSGGERELEYSWGGRLLLYKTVLDLVKDHPVFGLGPAAYRHYAATQFLSLGVGKALYRTPKVNSHNNYIDIYAQQGLVGLGLFLWFAVELGLVGWRLTSRFNGDFADGYVHGALGGLAGSLVAMMLVDWFLPFVYNVGFPGFRTSALAWMFLGGLVAFEQAAGKEMHA